MNPMEEIIRSAESAQLPALPAQTPCQGVAGAFSHKACLEVFEQPDIQFYPSFEEVFTAVSSGQRRYGVIPIENTLAGSVTDNYDLMLNTDCTSSARSRSRLSTHCLPCPTLRWRDCGRCIPTSRRCTSVPTF